MSARGASVAPHRCGEAWVVAMPGVLLLGANELIRMRSWDYRRYRNELYTHARAGLSRALPEAPLERCRVRIVMTRPARRFLDVDGKYGAIKPLLDVLQPDRAYSRPMGRGRVRDVTPGLGLIRSDTDGEGDATGCVRELRVEQRPGGAHVRIEVHPASSGADAP